MKTKIKITASLVIDIVFYSVYLLWGASVVVDYFGNEYSPEAIFIILFEVFASVLLYVSYILYIGIYWIMKRRFIDETKIYILIIPVLLCITDSIMITSKEKEKNKIESEETSLWASLIQSQRACEHSDQELYFKKNGQFLKHNYDRFSDDFCWTEYRIKGDTVFFNEKLSLIPSDTAIMKKDTLRFKGDTLVYKIHSSP